MKQGGEESVHLCDYPEFNSNLINEELESEMQEARDIVNLALALRSKVGIKVRQPLMSLKVKEIKTKLKDREDILDLIKDEVNVKEVIFDNSINDEVELDTNITPELKEEGEVREIIRQIQQMRKDMGFVPEDTISIYFQQSLLFDRMLERNKDNILKEVLAKEFILSEEEGMKEIEIGGEKILINIKKI